MTVNPSLLLTALAALPTADPVDWLMGDPWAELDLGRTSRLSLLKKAERSLAELNGRGGDGVGRGVKRPRASMTILARKPEAMVKLVRSGGTTNAKGMQGQASYLQKDGAVQLEASERHFGADLSGSLLDDTLSEWSRSASRDAKADRTTHFVVSFPEGTNELAAYLAGRAWAQEMFDEGTYGDVWDYYTAFHTDTAHPHMHVVVSRRGVEHGTWLKISRRGSIDYDELRFVQVEVAAREGIDLQATPRFARSNYQNPVADERQRIAQREGLPPERVGPTAYASAQMALQTLTQARSIQADADIIRDTDRSLAAILSDAADSLRKGEGWAGDQSGPLAPEAIIRAEETIMGKRDELVRNIDRVDQELATIKDGVARAPLEREASNLKARAADLLPGKEELRAWRATAEVDIYRGLGAAGADGAGDREKEIRDDAVRKARQIANNAGFDGKTIAERYASDTNPSQALAERWQRDEVDMFKRSRPIGFAENPEGLEEAASTAYTSVHRRIASQFTAARNELSELQAKRDAVRKEVQRRGVQSMGDNSARNDEAFAGDVRAVLSSREVEQLERGDLTVLNSVTRDDVERGQIAKRLLENETRIAEGARREQLREVVGRLDQADDAARIERQRLELEQARVRGATDRGLDL